MVGTDIHRFSKHEISRKEANDHLSRYLRNVSVPNIQKELIEFKDDKKWSGGYGDIYLAKCHLFSDINMFVAVKMCQIKSSDI